MRVFFMRAPKHVAAVWELHRLRKNNKTLCFLCHRLLIMFRIRVSLPCRA